jgi:glycosyltransferase involved in cell wall biosynthesis
MRRNTSQPAELTMNTTEHLVVSFVIPVLNGESDIARCLLSIRNQRFPEGKFEVLILDNGSTDRTHQIIYELGFDFQVLPKVSVSALRNRGAMMARGVYVAFVDADVELTPSWLQEGLTVFDNQEVMACGCFPGVPAEATWVQQTWDVHQRRCQLSQPTPMPWVTSMNMIVRRNDFLAISGFNERLKTSEDVDMCYRLGKRGVILYNPVMEAVHWGEARDLKTFWRKEVWRGMGNLKGVLSHGVRWDELPSLGYPLYVICLGFLFCFGFTFDLWRGQILLGPLSFVLLLLPAVSLALNTVRLAKCPGAIPKLVFLYFLYGFARAYSLIKS